jgi:hypothetical protein
MKSPRIKNSVPNPGSFTGGLDELFYQHRAQRLQKQREQVIEWLEKKWKADNACIALAGKQGNCQPGLRCTSPACPECSMAAQRLFTTIVEQFLKQAPDGNKLVSVTIVPADGQCQPGQLSPYQHERNIRRWKAALERAGVTWFIGGSDWSFNEHKTGRYQPHWSHHMCGITEIDDPADLKRRLLEQFPATNAIPRPVKVQVWDGSRRALRYAMKRRFWRRIGGDDGQRHDKRNNRVRTCRVTDKQPLRSKERRELLLHLDQIGLTGRLFLRWVQFANLRGSGPAIVKRVPKGRSRVSGQ